MKSTMKASTNLNMPENEDLSLAIELYELATAARKGEARIESRLLDLSNRLFKRPRCEAHFAEFDNAFADLSPDIVHAVTEFIDTIDDFQILIDLHGTWGEISRSQKRKLQTRVDELSCVTDEDEWNKRRWTNLEKKAARLSGTLKLEGLCQWVGSGEQIYSQLRPLFTDITVSYHATKTPYPEALLHPLRAFLERQLKSPFLRHLELTINSELGLETELIAFCSSVRCSFVAWNAPLSADFFVQVYNNLKSKHSVAIEAPKSISGFFAAAALREFKKALKMKRGQRGCWRTSRRAFSLYEAVHIKSTQYRSRVEVSIELKRCDERREDEEDDDPADDDDGDDSGHEEGNAYDYYYHDCGGKCKREALSEDNWKSGDCEHCGGCRYCRDARCDLCGICCVCLDEPDYDNQSDSDDGEDL